MAERSYVLKQSQVSQEDREEVHLSVIEVPSSFFKLMRSIPWKEGLSPSIIEFANKKAWSTWGKLISVLEYRAHGNKIQRYGGITTPCENEIEKDMHVEAFENIYDVKSEDKPFLEEARYRRILRGDVVKGRLLQTKLDGLPVTENPSLPGEILLLSIRLEDGVASCIPFSDKEEVAKIFPHAWTTAENETLYDVMGVNGVVLASKLSVSEITTLFKIEYKKVAASAEAHSQQRERGAQTQGAIINKNLLIVEHGTPLEETPLYRKRKEMEEKGRSYIYSEENCMAKAGDVDRYLQDKDFEYIEAVIRMSRERLFNHKEELQ